MLFRGLVIVLLCEGAKSLDDSALEVSGPTFAQDVVVDGILEVGATGFPTLNGLLGNIEPQPLVRSENTTNSLSLKMLTRDH